jgi:hypothetical protein
MRKYFYVFIITCAISCASSLFALTKNEKIKLEADYILSCQYINATSSANGAINDVTGNPTWVVPRENGMAILGLVTAYEVLGSKLYLDRANLCADYLVSVQDQTDGAWCNQYSYSAVVDKAKSPTQTAEVIIALYKLGYNHNRYASMKKGAQYLMECQKVTNIGGTDHGLLGGGKDSNGLYSSWRWTSDNSYAYWALKAAEHWAQMENENTFANDCSNSASKIITGIDTYLYDSVTKVWRTAIDKNGTDLGNPDMDPSYKNLSNWISYAPQMLDLSVKGVNTTAVGSWIKNSFQQTDGSCIAYVKNGTNYPIVRKYPGYSFQSSLCWLDIAGQSAYANNAINWAEGSTLWDTVNGGWIDWIEISPNAGQKAASWEKFIDTSFYSIACWNGGYNFKISPWILNLTPPYYKEEKSYYSAAASVKMVLDYIKGTSLTQTAIYNYGHSKNEPVNSIILDIDPKGVESALNNYDPAGYNFAVRDMANITDSMRDICHWMDYTVPSVSVQNVPAIVPTFGNYSNWMVVKGATASHDPSTTGVFTVYGFWMNDPAITGIGQNSFKTAAECEKTYFLPVTSKDKYNGKYVSVCEPPETLSGTEVGIEEIITNEHTVMLADTIRPVIDSENDITVIDRVKQELSAFSWNKIFDKRLLNDDKFTQAYAKSFLSSVIYVQRQDNTYLDYCLIPFSKYYNGKFLISLVVIVDAKDGYFKEVSWVNTPVNYSLMSKEKAVAKSENVAARNGLHIENPTARLVWFPSENASSPYYPFWEIISGSKRYYVHQNGNVVLF